MSKQSQESYLYVHIPFCRRRCSYCSFYSIVSDSKQDEFVNAMLNEITMLSSAYDVTLKTVYFGGGTPSALSVDNLAKILAKIKKSFKLADAEVTIEVNPEDVTWEKAYGLKNIGFNRVSMGVQSTNVKLLNLLNRKASFDVVSGAYNNLRKAGFDNISLDIMYGLPNFEIDVLKTSVETILSLQPEHVSIYCLSLDDKTVLKRKADANIVKLADEQRIDEEYEFLLEILAQKGYQRYEISNFCKIGRESRHNSSYWKYYNTLGIGPSACYKFDNARYENTADINQYIANINDSKLPIENKIELTDEELFIEAIFMGLRQVKGIDYDQLVSKYQIKDDSTVRQWIDRFAKRSLIELKNGNLRFVNNGLDVSNSILCELF